MSFRQDSTIIEAGHVLVEDWYWQLLLMGHVEQDGDLGL
jgi:hypothetical protein